MKRLVAMPQVLWFLLASTLAISHLAVATPVPSPTLGSRCPKMCGDVEVPYPFGIGADCARPGYDYFRVDCNHSFNPPRPYTGSLEIISISLDAGEVRVAAPVSYICYTSSNTFQSSQGFVWKVNAPYLISTARNFFTVIGCNTLAYLQGRDDWSYYTGCITSCENLEEAARNGEECTGLGCCQTLISRNLSTIGVNWNNGTRSINPAWSYSPCSYAILAEKGRYKFNPRDLVRDENDSFASWVAKEKIPMVLDWAIRGNGSCRPPAKDAGPSAKLTAPDCVSEHSFCVNATQGSGYLCNCSEGYRGNPYTIGGCTNINECQEYDNPCHSSSTCHDTLGDYKCKCKFGLKGDGKSDNGCQPIFPPWAIAIIATFAIVVVACFVIMDVKRRKQRRFFDKNGGEILKSMGINIFTEQQLKKITNSYKETIGEGAFGKVYIGTIDEGTQRVAVKRASVKGEALPQEEFVNEITFQFRISHANLVRLVGCCLETDVPMLVFEFISKGSLFNVLHGADDQEALRLLERVDIAIGSAEALAYMHSHGGHNHVHGDIKSGNILLSDDLTPKVSDFGSSKLVSVASMYSKWCVSGDMSYIDPVYIKSGRFTEKSDVYSFGVVLLELITRKKAKYGDNSLPLDFVKCCKEEGNGRKLYDRDILSDDDAQAHRHMECLDRIGALAVRCLKEDVDERPTMAEVLDELKQVKAIASGGSSGSVAS
ncbi:hypothetical protein SEVIR_8G189100v4 [Setaria viridis]|uniref:Protein kinase domain-containing protein n=1 Tax=Setaria viridis TaxID=4556 RepID=A0A4U6TLZ9_SETVI|nr:wall-associated receptor kinase 4-like [Setaria viridis]TKW01559.1 hypothetical protein SEVIR_8G189100v2 [Setaria viridis]